MEQLKLISKTVVTEDRTVYQLEYILHSAEGGRFYGVEILKTDEHGKMEREFVEGFCANREEAERFMERLAEGLALPMELVILCDEYISGKECTDAQKTA